MHDYSAKVRSVDRNLSERGRAFEAVGETAKALAKVGSTAGIVAALPRIADCIKDALPHMSRNRSTGFSLEALEVTNSQPQQ